MAIADKKSPSIQSGNIEWQICSKQADQTSHNDVDVSVRDGWQCVNKGLKVSDDLRVQRGKVAIEYPWSVMKYPSVLCGKA